MSFDLFVWAPPKPTSDEEVAERHRRACEGEEDEDDETAGESPSVDAFFAAVTARYEHLDRLPEDEVDASPWSGGPDRGDRWVSFAIRWSAAEEVAPWLVQVALRHGLVVYDPQEDAVTRPASVAIADS